MNLLTDPLIRARLNSQPGQIVRLSLPAVFAALMKDDVATFPALRPHQVHAWHMFLAQLGAITCLAAERAEPPESEDEWRSLLRALTTSFADDEPWRLLVADPAKPAFLQPPSPSGLADYRGQVKTPDDLDPLVTSRNHDLKSELAVDAYYDDWLFALVNLQTMEGFMGAGNYGVSRMNSGFSSRMFLGLAPPGGMGNHLRRDINTLLGVRQRIVDDPAFPAYRRNGGIALVWIEPWDGNVAIAMSDLDPYYLEICRRVRLIDIAGRTMARTANSRTTRIAAREISGLTGDPWAPIAFDGQNGGKTLSLTANGFGYRQLSAILFDANTRLPPAALFQECDGRSDMTLVARGLARGQGKTEGFHERFLVLSPKAAGLLRSPESRTRLGELATAQVDEIRTISSILRGAIGIVASGGKTPAEVSRDDRMHANPFDRIFDRRADVLFFPALWERFDAVDRNDEEAAIAVKGRFVRELIDKAQSLLDRACETVPCPAIRRYRARARAERHFMSRIIREFPAYVAHPSETPSAEEMQHDKHAEHRNAAANE